MKNILIAALLMLSSACLAAQGGETIKAKCAVRPLNEVAHEFINNGDAVRVTLQLLGGTKATVTISKKDYRQFIGKQASYELVLLADNTLVMRPTLERTPNK